MADRGETESAAELPAGLHTDVGFGNQYRLELIKTTLTVAVALLAFTVSFRPTLADPSAVWLIWVGWIALGLSSTGAMVNMYGWERIYISYRDYRGDRTSGEKYRERTTVWRRIGMAAQFGGFAVGVLSIAVFSAINLDKVQAATTG